MKRLIKSNGQVFHSTKNLLLTLEFIFHSNNINSSEDITEIKLYVNEELSKTIEDYLDDISERVANYLIQTYPVTTGEIKPNNYLDSMYLPVALLDDSYPRRLRVELNSFANINRISNHTQQDKESKNIEDARNTTIKNFKEELDVRLSNESRIDKHLGKEGSYKENHHIVENYQFPGDFSICLISPEDGSEKIYSDLSDLIPDMGDKIYLNLCNINNINK